MKVRDDIVFFEGKISHSLMMKPMVSNAYFVEDGDEVILFDPSCGKEIAQRIEAYIHKRREAGARWRSAVLIAGHSHMDHANNFYLSDVIGAEETHIYVHESGFRNGIVMNEPISFNRSKIEESKKYYNTYLSVYGPAMLLAYPLVILDKLSPTLAAKLFSRLIALPWPTPVNGDTNPEPLREEDAQMVDLGAIKSKGWRLGNKVILATPGHSPCSVSLFCPEIKAIFISDADWYGNPVFVSSSLKDCISSLEMMKRLTEAGKVGLFLPAHGEVKEGGENILNHLDSCIKHLETIRDEVLSAYRSYNEKDIIRLTKILVNKYPLFRTLKQSQYPKAVVFIHNMVTVCLKEEGILA
jgi:glyoxylase-like metal-dependent hydrolase (beta-lactamase superfamily II)